MAAMDQPAVDLREPAGWRRTKNRIATWLMVTYKPETWPISVYMIILAVITVVSVYFATETRQIGKPELPAAQPEPLLGSAH